MTLIERRKTCRDYLKDKGKPLEVRSVQRCIGMGAGAEPLQRQK